MTTTTLRLGEGETSVAAFYGDQGAHGIGFFPAPEGTKSGDTWSDHEKIGDVEKSDCFLLITATNPDALRVMIDQLKTARRKMQEKLGEIAKPSKEGFAQQY